MKAFGLFVFATVFLLSAALPNGKGIGRHSLESDRRKDGASLQRRKPPVKIPGPALRPNDSHSEITHKDESNPKLYSDDEKEGKHAHVTKDRSRNHGHSDSLNSGGDRETSKHLTNSDDEKESKQAHVTNDKSKNHGHSDSLNNRGDRERSKHLTNSDDEKDSKHAHVANDRSRNHGHSDPLNNGGDRERSRHLNADDDSDSKEGTHKERGRTQRSEWDLH